MSIIIAFVVFNLIIITVICLYCKLTCGYCKCSRHLVGKVVIVTGANAGIGFETARDLAERGARVYLACRNEKRGIEARDKIIALTSNKDIHYRQLDLDSLKSVRKFVDNFLKSEKRLEILINNAGLIDAGHEITEDGLLVGMQTNHFGPFLLTNLLIPVLKKSAPSRIVTVSSYAHRFGKIDFDNLNMEKETAKTFRKYNVYTSSKLCNVLMTVELARTLEGTGVTANCLHPGAVETDILGSTKRRLIKMFSFVSRMVVKTPWEGAQTSIYLAVSPEVEQVSGGYFSDCRKLNLSKAADDVGLARKLWEISETLVKLK